MTKIAVNRSSGSFRLSPQIVQRMCELRGIPCYFFSEVYTDPDNPESNDYEQVYVRQTVDNCPDWFWAFTIPNPNEVFGIMQTDEWRDLSDEERSPLNTKYNECYIDTIFWKDHQTTRTNPFLIQAIKEIGQKNIEIVEIPDDVEWFIQESESGYETIHERHRVW